MLLDSHCWVVWDILQGSKVEQLSHGDDSELFEVSRSDELWYIYSREETTLVDIVFNVSHSFIQYLCLVSFLSSFFVVMEIWDMLV